MKDFAGKVGIVTGAASGIGRATAIALAKRGAALVLADIDEPQGEALAAELRGFGGSAIFVAADVARPEQCEHLAAAAKSTFGRLDLAFNNAGISDSGDQPASHEYPLALWRRMLDIDLSGVFHCLRYQLPLLLENGGAIVNTASIQAFKSYPGTPAYSAAKAGVVNLTRLICNEYGARGIRCNAVAPGVIETPLNRGILQSPQWRAELESRIPAGRVGQPEEIAEAVIWLCSPAASYVNGVCLNVDGGLLTR